MKTILKYMHKKRKRTGFTIIELLISVGIVVVILAIILALISNSRAKAADARTQETLGNIRTIATEEKLESESFAPAFQTDEPVAEAVEAFAAQQGLVAGEYTALASDNDFVIIFPLKAKDGYWCVDAEGNAKQVQGKEPLEGMPYNCENVDEEDDGGSGTTDTSPVLTAYGPTGTCNSGKTQCLIADCSDIGCKQAFPQPGVFLQGDAGFLFDGVTVVDNEDGTLTDEVQVIVSSLSGSGASIAAQINAAKWAQVSSCHDNYWALDYSATDSDNNSVSHMTTVYYCTLSDSGDGGVILQ